MLTLKPRDHRPAYKKQVNLDHLHEKQVNDPHDKTDDFPPAHENGVKLNTNIKP